MTFGQCIELWKKHPGKAFRRATWPEEHFVEVRHGTLMYCEGEDYEAEFAPFTECLFATDWEEC